MQRMQDWFVEFAGKGWANAKPRIVRATDEKDAIRVLAAAFGWTNVRLYRGKRPYGGQRIRYYVDHCYGLHDLLTGERNTHPDWVLRDAELTGRPIRCERTTLDILPAWEVDDWAKRKWAVRESRKALQSA